MRVESPVVFECAGDRLVGVSHAGDAGATIGVVIVVGGPQYRVGSHRQFVLMARSLADAGTPVLRVDYRGMGDSEGESRSFENVDEDIRAAISLLVVSNPNIANVVLIGLCDAASAISIYASKDDRVRGLVLINPWVTTAGGQAGAYLKYYYLQRLFQKSFWQKVLGRKFAVRNSMRQFLGAVSTAFGARRIDTKKDVSDDEVFVSRMLMGLEHFRRPVLFLLSGRDLTAREFDDLCYKDRRWKSLVSGVGISIERLPEADHTFSTKDARSSAVGCCEAWLRSNFI